MPSKFDNEELRPLTEGQRLENRRFEAGFAFETMPDDEFARRNLHPVQFQP